MRDKSRKIISLAAAAVLSLAAFAGCGEYSTKVPGAGIGQGEVVSNGGFAVEQGDYVYFINGAENYTADNTYGDVVKGALMRIAKSDLRAGNYSELVTVVPMLFVAQNFDAGVYIYGDTVYFASPTTEKDQDGNVQSDWISFKSAKLDGSSAMKDYYFRSSSNSAEYRYVEMNGVVYCLHVDGTTLYSYNTKTGADTVLVEGASDYFFDVSDAENPVVYYTMSVTQDADTDHSTSVSYTQLYAVSADATVSVNADAASYTFNGTVGGKSYEKTYDFDGGYLGDNLDGFDAEDYTTYPYVNLGTLVLDGLGSLGTYKKTQFTDDTQSVPSIVSGYTYTVQSYQNGGLYFTRADAGDSSDGENSKLRYLADETWQTADWKSVAGNASAEIDVVAKNTTNASSTALFYIENGTHYYIYLSDSKIYRVKADENGGEAESVCLTASASGATLWKKEGGYLYYYASGSNGNNLTRLDCSGKAEDYSPFSLMGEEAYKPAQILAVDWNSSWYKPEFFENTLLFSNAQSFGSVAYNYIYAVNLAGSGEDGYMTTEELIAFNEKYEEVDDYITELNDKSSSLGNALRYYFRTGKTEYFEEILAEAKEIGYNDYYLYSDYEIKEFRAFTGKKVSENTAATDYTTMFDADKGDAYYGVESYFMNLIGVVKEDDADAIEEAWQTQFIRTLPEEEDEGWTTWQKVLLGVGIGVGVLIVAAAIAVPLVIRAKKKRAREEEYESVAVRKPIIDTTDDKSIDVYADDADLTADDEETREADEETSDEVAENAEETEETDDVPAEPSDGENDASGDGKKE